MEMLNHFIKLLREIRPTDDQKTDAKNGHTALRKRICDDEGLKELIVSTFLQGSYRRATAIRPDQDNRIDVDVIVVTRIDKNRYPDPNKAMDLFIPFLKNHYKGKYTKQGRSFGIELSDIDLDMVITSAPSEAAEAYLKSEAVIANESPEELDDWRLAKSWTPLEMRQMPKSDFLNLIALEAEWKSDVLLIPNRDAYSWESTNPLEQIKWTWGKNARCNKHYVNIVKAIKWWQRLNYPDDRPSGYPLEHLIGICCPDQICSVAEGVTKSMEVAVALYTGIARQGTVPNCPDHGVPQHNVFSRITGQEFKAFIEHITLASVIAREALDAQSPQISAQKWRQLFGDKFPPADDDDKQKGDPSGPFIAPGVNSQTGDMTTRRYAN